MISAKSSEELYNEYKHQIRKIADVKNALNILQWDQETYLPSKGASFRAQQTATLSELAHQLFTSEYFGNILQELNSRNNLSQKEKRNVELSNEDYIKQKKFTSDFVKKMSETVSKSFHAWIDARRQNAFSAFEKDLNGLLQLKKEEAYLLGFENHPYNALLNEFEKGCTVKLLDKIFTEILYPLKKLFDQINSKPQIDDSCLHQYFPKQQQWDFGIKIIGQLGFDFKAGRQDISEHPFTTSFNNNDVRITTRIDEHNFAGMLWSCIHESGHALYEQGLPETEYGLPLGEYTSLGIHESQSRLWENCVGRGKTFWNYHYKELQDTFPDQLAEVSLQQFYKAINKVEPSLIRTEADELTYHFHVMIRYEIEKLLIEGTIGAHDIPAYWNEHYEKYLDLKVPDDKRGCLQDIHWSHGSFGYFPTYSLGSFYAAQLYGKAIKQNPAIEQAIGKGDTNPLLDYLRKHIFQYGRMYTSEELFAVIGGEPLDIKYFLEYLFDKYKNIYIL
ncbi:MAG TPA: carboxypeptidase M32 [Puia sp.]|nr:carboxypeptidase M32 [Puia sp.]